MKAIVLAAVVAAGPAAASVAEPAGYRMDHYRAAVPDTVRGAAVVHTQELPALMAKLHPVLVDVLPAPEPPADGRPGLPRLPLPHKDIPGSIWLPEVGRGAISQERATWFLARLREATGGDMKRPVVFYCLSNCWMSWNATKRAASVGYERAYWYPEGADGWEAAGLPVQTATPAR
jgi:PQQ-dependent catabolism-associated CXXCW motif protein